MDAKGFGETEPLVSNKTRDGREKNRRVEFKIIDDGVEEAPVVEEPVAIPDTDADAVEDALEEDVTEADTSAEDEGQEAAPEASEETRKPIEAASDDDMPEGDE